MGPGYCASVAQWKADLAAQRPKVAKLVANPQLHVYVLERLSGQIRRPDGTVFWATLMRVEHRNQTPGRGSRHLSGRAQNRKWADLMATNGQFYWPSVGSSVAACGQSGMAAKTRVLAWMKPLKESSIYVPFQETKPCDRSEAP